MLDNISQSLNGANIEGSTVVQVAGNLNIDNELLKQLLSVNISENTLLLNNLISNVLKDIKKCIDNDDLNISKSKIDSILTYGLTGINKDNKEELYYFKGYVHLRHNEQENVHSCIDMIDSIKFDSKLSLKLKIKKSINNSNEEELEKLLLNADKNGFSKTEINEFKLQILLRTCQFQKIINDYESNSHTDSDLCSYAIGMAFLNQQNYEKAKQFIDNAYTQNNKVEYKFGQVLVDILPIFSKRGGQFLILDKDKSILNDSKEILLSIKDNYDKKQNEEKLEFYEMLLNTMLFIDIEKVIETYKSIPEAIKKHFRMRVIIAGYYELNEEYDKALDYYESVLEDTNNLNILVNIFSILFIQKKYEEIISRFDSLKNTDDEGVLAGLYLRSVKATTPEKLEEEILSNEKYYKNQPMFYLVASGLINDNNENKNCLFNELLKYLDYENEYMVIETANIAYEMNRISDTKRLLLLIEGKSVRANIKLISLLRILHTEEDIELLEKIVDREIENGNKSELVLSAKADILFDKGKYREAIKVFEEIFSLYPSERIGGNILSLKIETKSKYDLEKYLAYLLDKSRSPLIIILCARGYELIGKNRTSEELAYRAMYLQENIDKNTVEQYLIYYFGRIMNSPDGIIEPEYVIDDSVIILKDIKNNSEKIICINSEEYYCDECIAIGARQIGRNNFTYVKLLGNKKGDSIILNEEEYIIESIIDKYAYTFRYILDIYDKCFPDSRFIRKVSVSNPEEFIAKMMELNQERRNGDLLDSYNSIDNNVGVPIDYLVMGAYEKYHEVIKYLLYNNKCLLYAGEKNNFKDIKSRKIVISLSTLVILNTLDKLKLLDNIKEQVLIVESLKTKAINIFTQINNMSQKSHGELLFMDDNKPIYIKNDKQSNENRIKFWRTICEYINGIETIKIQDELIIQSQMESLFNNIDICELESILLAKQLNAVYMCDDLFFRKICFLDNIQVETTNFTSLFDLLENKEDYFKEILELSKTNYIYCAYQDNISALLKDTKYGNELISNLTNTQKKVAMYSKVILYGLKS